MLGPDFKLPDDNGGVKWKASKSTAETHLPDDWWKLFNDPELNRLVDRALAANNDLAAGRARVDTARALVGLDRARLFPSLDLTGSANTTRSSAGAMPPGPVTNLENQNYRSNFDLAYDPDLWGRNKRAIEASSAEAAAAQALFDSQRLGIATEVASSASGELRKTRLLSFLENVPQISPSLTRNQIVHCLTFVPDFPRPFCCVVPMCAPRSKNSARRMQKSALPKPRSIRIFLSQRVADLNPPISRNS